jgi:hypothetical protein
MSETDEPELVGPTEPPYRRRLRKLAEAGLIDAPPGGPYPDSRDVRRNYPKIWEAVGEWAGRRNLRFKMDTVDDYRLDRGLGWAGLRPEEDEGLPPELRVGDNAVAYIEYFSDSECGEHGMLSARTVVFDRRESSAERIRAKLDAEVGAHLPPDARRDHRGSEWHRRLEAKFRDDYDATVDKIIKGEPVLGGGDRPPAP